jgi:hypothetical protein
MENTIIQQGRFTSTGAAKTLQIRSDIDWMKIYNVTVAAAGQTTAVGVEYYWQKGMPVGSQWEYKKSNAANAANLSSYITTGGFTVVDSTLGATGAIHATITAISNAAIPVVTVGVNHTLSAGNIVRLIDCAGGQQLGGMDFTVGYNTLGAGTFSLDYMAQIVAATTGSYRLIPYDAIFYPRRRYVTKITQAANAVVTMSVTHGYTIGQKVRFTIPSVFGMVEMNGLLATIIAINTTTTSGNTITLDIDSSAFTAFAFPVSAAVPFTYAEVVPVGENTSVAIAAGVDYLADATVNTGFIGMVLDAGADRPAGQNNDVIYWVAGKSFSIDNQ